MTAKIEDSVKNAVTPEFRAALHKQLIALRGQDRIYELSHSIAVFLVLTSPDLVTDSILKEMAENREWWEKNIAQVGLTPFN